MSDRVWLFVTVPAVTAFIGYVTNWAAVRMMFHPAEPKGIGPLRWQGIVYRMGHKFAREIANTTGQVLTPADIAERVDINGLVERLHREHEHLLDDALGAGLDVLAPGSWARMDPGARAQLRTVLLAQATGSVDGLVGALGDRLPEILDLDELLVAELTGENADRLARVAAQIAGRELRFIEIYGAVFGFGVGVVQAALYGVFGIWWTMPIVGGLVGLGTNWLAIQMIFRPLEPVRLLGLRYQGLFPKRQPEIAADYGRIAGEEILTPATLLSHLSTGPTGERVAAEVIATVERQVARQLPAVEPLSSTPVTPELEAAVRDVVMTRVVAAFDAVRPALEQHLDERLGVAEIVEGKLAAMDPPRFERVLRGIFEEDEIILVVIGGVLGGSVGVLQGAIVLGAGV